MAILHAITVTLKEGDYMKRPNGSGSVVKLSGKRRKPYAILLTESIILENGKAKQVRRYAGYFEKRTDALRELEKYNTNPSELASNRTPEKKLTFADIYELWLDDLSKKPKPLSRSSMDGYRAAYKKYAPLHKMVFEKITVKDYEDVAKTYTSMSHTSIKTMKLLLNQMYKTAMRYSIVDTNLSELLLFYSTNENANPHKIFTDEEIDALWGNKCDFIARLLLILIYTGLRVRELLNMKTEDVHLEDRYMVGGLKTDAGKNRIIPISEKIVPLLNTSGEYLIKYNGSQLKYRYAWQLLNDYMEAHNMNHDFHDTRHTTATKLEQAEVPLLHRKLILGHASGDVTDRYTHISTEQLIEDINKI